MCVGWLSESSQGGNLEVPNTGSKKNVTATLPISWNRFLQGTATHNWPDVANQFVIDSVAINCTTANVTVSARANTTTSSTGIRYVVFGY